jgi:hypothetical protein
LDLDYEEKVAKEAEKQRIRVEKESKKKAEELIKFLNLKFDLYFLLFYIYSNN